MQNDWRGSQFSLSALLEYVTVCAVLAALSAVIGVAASVCLMLMARALWFRQGPLALGLLIAASLASDSNHSAPLGASAMAGQSLIILSAAALAGWYSVRCSLVSRAVGAAGE